MMRRAVLLMVTTALALFAAGGIALAAAFTCTANPCDGTTDDDVITGTLNAETINGKAGNDEISALDANDTINGEDGNDTMHGELGDDWLNGGDGPDQLLGGYGYDRLNGGAGNDSLDGGADDPTRPSATDFYLLTTNWGQDTITDAGGQDLVWLLDDATAAAMPNLTVDLVSSSGPEYTDGNGNTVNWEGNIVDGAMTGAGDDVISQSPSISNSMNGGAGSDTYKGFTFAPFGGDSIGDSGGTADVLDLSSRSLASAGWATPKATSTSNVQGLRIDFHGGTFMCIEEFCNFVTIGRYFDNTSRDVCASGPGPGVIESIKFAPVFGDDPTSVNFAQAQNFASSTDGIDNDGDGSIDEFGGEPCTPTVTNVVPTHGNQNVAIGTNIEASFSEAMDASTSDGDASTIDGTTFTLTKPDGPDADTNPDPVAGVVSYDSATTKATLNPTADLDYSTTYTAIVTTGAEDLAGNKLDQDLNTSGNQPKTWSFTTAAPPVCTKTGTANAETISGTSGDDVICAGGGNDTLRGLGGNDTLRGEAGNDKLLGGTGNDTLDGGLGADTASYSDSLTAVIASLATNSATGEGFDTFADVENLLGSSQADTLTGSGANNTLTGGGGMDTENGGAGDDLLEGSGGADTLDAIDGVSGNDGLNGGNGTDTCRRDATERSIRSCER